MFHDKLHAEIQLHLLSILRHMMIRGRLSWYWYRHVMICGILLMMSECPIWTWCCSLLPPVLLLYSPTDSTAVTFPDPTALLASNLSESQTVIHHYVQQMGGFMWVSVYWCTSPHDSTMPSQPLCFMPRWKCGWWLALWRLRIHLWLWSLSCCVWLRNLYLFLTEWTTGEDFFGQAPTT